MLGDLQHHQPLSASGQQGLDASSGSALIDTVPLPHAAQSSLPALGEAPDASATNALAPDLTLPSPAMQFDPLLPPNLFEAPDWAHLLMESLNGSASTSNVSGHPLEGPARQTSPGPAQVDGTGRSAMAAPLEDVHTQEGASMLPLVDLGTVDETSANPPPELRDGGQLFAQDWDNLINALADQAPVATAQVGQGDWDGTIPYERSQPPCQLLTTAAGEATGQALFGSALPLDLAQPTEEAPVIANALPQVHYMPPPPLRPPPPRPADHGSTSSSVRKGKRPRDVEEEQAGPLDDRVIKKSRSCSNQVNSNLYPTLAGTSTDSGMPTYGGSSAMWAELNTLLSSNAAAGAFAAPAATGPVVGLSTGIGAAFPAHWPSLMASVPPVCSVDPPLAAQSGGMQAAPLPNPPSSVEPMPALAEHMCGGTIPSVPFNFPGNPSSNLGPPPSASDGWTSQLPVRRRKRAGDDSDDDSDDDKPLAEVCNLHPPKKRRVQSSSSERMNSHRDAALPAATTCRRKMSSVPRTKRPAGRQARGGGAAAPARTSGGAATTNGLAHTPAAGATLGAPSTSGRHPPARTTGHCPIMPSTLDPMPLATSGFNDGPPRTMPNPALPRPDPAQVYTVAGQVSLSGSSAAAPQPAPSASLPPADLEEGKRLLDSILGDLPNDLAATTSTDAAPPLIGDEGFWRRVDNILEDFSDIFSPSVKDELQRLLPSISEAPSNISAANTSTGTSAASGADLSAGDPQLIPSSSDPTPPSPGPMAASTAAGFHNGSPHPLANLALPHLFAGEGEDGVDLDALLGLSATSPPPSTLPVPPPTLPAPPPTLPAKPPTLPAPPPTLPALAGLSEGAS